MISRLGFLGAAVLGCLAAAPVQASTRAYVEALGFLSEPSPSAYKPGMLLWVEDLGPQPGLTTILCNSNEVVGEVPLVRTSFEGVRYKEQANWPKYPELGDMLQEINKDSPGNMVDQIELDIANVWASTLPDEILASIPRLSNSCRIKLAQWRQTRRAHSGGFAVIATSQLSAGLSCVVSWSPFCRQNQTTSIFTMHMLAQWLGINGGCVFHGRVVGPPQQIGWQHDQGSLGGELLSIGAQSTGNFSFGSFD